MPRIQNYQWIVAMLCLIGAPNTPAADDYAATRQALVTAYQSGDYQAALSHAREALQFRPDYPPLLSTLAVIQSRLGQPEAALATLVDLSESGVAVTVAEESAFERVRGLDEYARFKSLQEHLAAPVGEYRVAARLDQSTFVPEGIGLDSDGNFYLGSVRHGRITRLADGKAESFVKDWAHGLASVFGIRVDEEAELLWAATAVVAQGNRVNPQRIGRSGILRFRLTDGAFVDAFWLPADEAEHVLGDLILLDEYTAVTTDSLTGAVLELDTRSGEFTPLIERGRLNSPQGIVFDASRNSYFIADWSSGLYQFHRHTGDLIPVDGPTGTMLYGIDGLYLYEGDLIAVQNLAHPHRVTRLRLDAAGQRVTDQETLARALPEFDEPTLATIRNDKLYLNANSHWNRFDDDNRLPDTDSLTGPIILEIPLR